MKSRIALNNPKTYVVLFADVLLLTLAYAGAYWLKFEYIWGDLEAFFWASLPILLAVKLTVFFFYGLESGMWRYTSLNDLLNLVKASLISFVVIMVILFFLYYESATGLVSRSVFIIDTINTLLFIGAFRLSIRLYYSRDTSLTQLLRAFLPSGAKRGGEGIPVAIYGANERGELLLRSLMSNIGGRHLRPVGFIDNQADLDGGRIHGYKVLGSLDNFDEIARRFDVSELLIASRLSGPEMERANQVCHEAGVTLRVVPAHLDEKMSGIDVSSLRDIRIEDLLNRDPATIDYSTIMTMLKGKKVMVTGAGGSIGAELCMQIARFEPSQMILIDKSENYLFDLEQKLSRAPDGVSCDFLCADITDEERTERIFKKEKPVFVFHAAAHKHVPLMERNRSEAIRNNVGGIKVMSQLSLRYGVERFILISTDKAVAPANIMGATKRLCELYIQNLAGRSGTLFMAVRFGNVLGSNGSVVPLFRHQIEARGPVTVTHPDMERYFMTIPEAVMLILQAASFGEQGGLYLLDMGEPVRIDSLARQMIAMAGFTPDVDIDITYTGLRPGEKMTEELTGSAEELIATEHAMINRVVTAGESRIDVESFADELLATAPNDPERVYHSLLQWIETGARCVADGRVMAPFSRSGSSERG